MTAKMKRCRSRQQKPRKKPTTPRKSGNRGTIANTCQYFADLREISRE